MEYDEQNDDAPKTDSQDSCDHSCRPQDPQVGTSWSPQEKEKIGLVFSKCLVELRGSGHLFPR